MGNPADTIQLLETFTRIADAGSLSAAARSLGVSQASVSRQLSALEARLKTALARRSTHELTLTEEGYRFFGNLDFDFDAFAKLRRPMCRPCLDWSVRRHHMAGSLGKALLQHCLRKRWARAAEETRIIRFSKTGEDRFRAAFVEPG